MRGPIVVGTDGSDTSRLALEEAASIAKGNGQAVVVTYVRRTPFVGLGVLSAGGECSSAVQEALDAEEALAEAQSIAILEAAPVCWCFEVRTGEPTTEIMRVAEEFKGDTIIVAGRRHGAFGGLAHGSVCAQLLHRWPRSLLVIHPPPHPSGKEVASGVLGPK